MARSLDESIGIDKAARARLVDRILKKKRETLVGKVKGKVVDAVEKIPESVPEAKKLAKDIIKKHGLSTGGPIERAVKQTTALGGIAIPIPGSALAGIYGAKRVGKLGRKADEALGLAKKKK